MARPFSKFWKNTLTPLKGKIKQYSYIGFDVETFGDDNKFYSGGLYYYDDKGEEVWEYYIDKNKLIEAMLSRRFRNKTIVATNLGFDLTSLFFDTKYWNDFRLTSRGSDILLASYELGNNNGKIKIIDTMNFVPFSVEKLGKIIGTDKLEKPSFWKLSETGDYIVTKPKNVKEQLELEIYNKQDCKISCDFMFFLQKGINEAGGNLKITIASTSLDVWRRGHLDRFITKENFYIEDVKDFIFKAYYGGRTEVFKRGYFEELNYYDINSLYPSVMRNKYPLPQSIKKVPIPTVKFIHMYEGVTECDVTCPDDLHKPLLPIKTSDGKLIFPTGNFRGVYNNVELRKAISLGYEILPIKQIIYTETFYPFVSYVNTFYKKRLEYKSQNNNMELVMKLLLNSLYGKFAQKEKQQMTINNIDFLSEEEQKRLLMSNEPLCIKNNHLIDVKKSNFDGLFSFPILSSYTTSYARLLMYEFLEKTDTIYMDTDSIVCKEVLENNKELGKMKLEYKVDKAIFVKPKFYLMNDDVKIKGVNKASLNDFFDILDGKSVKKMKFSKLRESIRRGMNPNTKMLVDKSLNLDDNKREWRHNFQELILNKTYEESKPLKVQVIGGINYTDSELNRLKEKQEKVILIDHSKKVKEYIKNNPLIKSHYKGKTQELTEAMNLVINRGLDIDLIDWISLDSNNISESLEDNYNIKEVFI